MTNGEAGFRQAARKNFDLFNLGNAFGVALGGALMAVTSLAFVRFGRVYQQPLDSLLGYDDNRTLKPSATEDRRIRS